MFGDERLVIGRVHVEAERPEEEPEAVELDVRTVVVAVALFGAVPEVARHADPIGPADLRRVPTSRSGELELQRRPCLGVVTARDHPGDRISHVAHPGDVPLRVHEPEPRRQTRQHLTEAPSRFTHLPHAQDHLRLQVERRVEAQPFRAVGVSFGVPARPLGAHRLEDTVRGTERVCRPGAHGVHVRAGVFVERPGHCHLEATRRAWRQRLRRALQRGRHVVGRSRRAHVI